MPIIHFIFVKIAYKKKILTAVNKKRRRWQNDTLEYMHMKRILFKLEDSGMDIALVTRDVEAEARKIYRFRPYLGGKNGERKEIGSAILLRRTNGGSINIKK